jgi:calcineurin-like phosphoesterase family protein
MKRWILTDTHWNHEAMITRGWRPANYQERSLANIRRLVAPEDKVLHLGDVIFARSAELQAILLSLPGIWELVKGNHDHRRDQWYRDMGFAAVNDAAVIGDVYLTHEPAGCLLRDTRLNVHGHLHDDLHRVEEGYPEPWHRLLALELTDYCPVLFDEFTR